MKRLAYALALGLSLGALARPACAQEAVWPAQTHHRFATVAGQRIFYREAGDASKPVVLLLHGYPSSSHAYRQLIPLLSGRYRVIAPDYLGSGYSDKPDPRRTRYTFDLLEEHVSGLVEALGIKSFVLYMHDFGAPVGFRLMMRDPSRVRGIISQNANAYLEGIPPTKLAFFRKSGTDHSPTTVQTLFEFTSPRAVREQQYLRDVREVMSVMSPDTWTMDSHHLESDRDRQIQVQLFQDYKTNLDQYGRWQKFLRKVQPPTLLVWGAKDPVFTPSGARAYLRDVPNAKLVFLDAGHFALEEKPVEIAKEVINFMSKLPNSQL